ncbi:HAD-IIB family hydrolase [Bacillus sp. KH172YL63]|uniref:HAD-IIB family hydrolase n=1 Tax=Bacillus sp. KH172YL63 TaxID=2709784 RepID=UPI0013E4F748|nr:HAD-IIB family hydrolase [Bacillus sp. KH172YL63]BCB03617.1 Cof-type HAD-IIB family hydrolase [Bacillus sp. KH172YL63]
MKFVFDLDGTICFKGKPVSENIVACLLDIKNQGHDVIFASARPIRDMLPVLDVKLHSFPMIGGNGSLLYKNGEVLHSTAFDSLDLKQILHLIDKYDVTYLIDGEWDYAYTGTPNHPILSFLDPANLAQALPVESLGPIVKVLLLTGSNVEGLTKELKKMDIVVHTHTDEEVVDLSPQNVHKWSALSSLGVKEGDFIAFGNDANDLSMFQHAKHAVMVGYHEGLSAFADEEIPLMDDYEEDIIQKLRELSSQYREVKKG